MSVVAQPSGPPQQEEPRSRPALGASVRRIASSPLFVRVAIGAGVLAGLCLVPSIADGYTTGLFVTMAIFSVVTMAWNLVFGYAGVFSLGQMAFFAVGAYASALSTIHWAFSPWAGLFFGGLVAAVAGAAMGIPSLRLHGPYMVLFTLAFQLALAALIPTVWTGTTGGSSGLYGLKLFEIGDADPLKVAFYAAVGMALVVFLLIAFVLRSPIGAAMEVLRDGQVPAEARGIGFFQHRVILFVLSAFFTGVAGAFYAHYLGIITPSVLALGLLINLLAWMTLGGLRTMLGPIVGAMIGVYLNDSLAQTQEYSQLIWGLVLVGVIMVAPGGVVTTGAQLFRWLSRLALATLRGTPRQEHVPEFVRDAKRRLLAVRRVPR